MKFLPELKIGSHNTEVGKRRLTVCSKVIILLLVLSSCEEVIKVDLNATDPAFVAEAVIYKDSVILVHLTRTSNYFSKEAPDYIENARIKVSDGTFTEELSYRGNGYYTGNTLIGTEEKNYEIEIEHEGIIYKGASYMPLRTDIVSVRYSKNNDQGIFNPSGKTMFIIQCEFLDEPGVDNYYMVRYILDGEVLSGSYYVLNEQNTTNGTIEISDLNRADNDTISFEEWMFYEGGTGEVQVFSIDKSVYDYFVQLNDILFWKRRFNPPSPYNPKSNIDNGALGYFAAWAYDSRKIVLE
jgi:hypothetical protein